MTQVPADYLSTTSSYNYEQPLPSMTRTNTISQVPPAKKITFFKSGDPQFGGVKMAVNQRSFKSFSALMDDLSHRVPLPFGVRTITTPRGIHCISELDQLEDGGCYLCSDKKYVKPISISSAGQRPGPPRNGRPFSTLRRVAQEGRLEDYSTPFTQHGPRIPKKITLLKNGEIGFRRSIILNRRNARSFKMLLDEISEILQFPVKKFYTVDGKKASISDTWCWSVSQTGVIMSLFAFPVIDSHRSSNLFSCLEASLAPSPLFRLGVCPTCFYKPSIMEFLPSPRQYVPTLT
uniref:Doublecortin domain-containing protein n=1 Tax=Apteryx owenii TaxID=8824 RepID=A0A8B9SBK6_APTOW